MSVRRHIHFGSTPNWNNLYKEVKANRDSADRFAYAKYDPSLGEPPTEEQKVLLQEYTPDMPTITFIGSEKLHGENMAVCYSQGELWVQGRNHIRTLLGDQNGMAAFVNNTHQYWLDLFTQVEDKFDVDSTTHTIVIDCEWAGGNIQKGNSACSGTDKGAYIFDYCRVVNNDTDESQSYSTKGLQVASGNSMYLMSSFGSYELVLDLNKPEKCEEQLKALAESIEDTSPIADYHNKKDNVGEGAYLYGTDIDGTMYRLKTKGLKHGGKPKIPREPKTKPTDAEILAIDTLANAVTPEWRLTQGITESGATEMKHIGEVIKWVMADIAKEEEPVIAASGIEFKKARGTIVKIIKDYYIDSIKGY